MTDQFMRIGGRDTEGLARPLKISKDGNLKTTHSGNNELITSLLDVNVPANTRSGVLANIDVGDYSQIYVGIRSQGFHDFKVEVQFGTKHTNTFGTSLTGAIAILDARNKNYATSRTVDVVADLITFLYLENKHTADLKYDIFIYGKKESTDKTVNDVERSSAKHSELAGTTERYSTVYSEVGIYVESGSVRVVSNGDDATLNTGIPLGYGHYNYWNVASLSVYFEQDSTITVVYR